jgi:hypothetical protein
MLQKKLITLAAILGILACGACFRDYEKAPPSQPPTLQLNLDGIREITITVKNLAKSNFIDTESIARHAIDKVNASTKTTGLRAHLAAENEQHDANLEINILSVEAVPTSPVGGNRRILWKIPIITKATLTRRDGIVIWSEDKGDHSYDLFTRGKTAKDVLRDHRWHAWAEGWVGQSEISQMLYGVSYR